jgi:Rhs element Vgr protein
MSTNNGRLIPTGKNPDLVTFKILSNGTEISAEYRILSIVVERAVNQIAFAQVTISDGDIAKEKFEISEAAEFIPGREIEIKAGYHSDEKSIFKGIVVKHGVKAQKDRPSILKIECKHAALRLASQRRNKYFYNVSEAEILETVIKSAGLKAKVESIPLKHAEMVQFNTSDWDFIALRAEATGRFILTLDDGVTVKKPDFGQNPVVKLQFGGNVMDFELEMDARTQIGALKAANWNIADGANGSFEAKSPSIAVPSNLKAADLAKVVKNEQVTIHTGGSLKDKEVQAWADATLLRSRLAQVRGQVQCQGFNTILPAQMVELAGMGDRFNGKAFVSGVRHEIRQNDWKTALEIGLPMESYSEVKTGITAPKAAGLVPSLHGLHIGIVTKLEGDPNQEFRVQVRLPFVSEKGEGTWARVACLDAGKERGTFFRPERGDEVVLGFLDDDPRQAIILGMLNSSKNPAPLPHSDENHKKAIVTRSKIKITFDDEKKILSFETPAGHKMKLDDDDGSIKIEDKNGNQITMNKDGILLKSAKDIQFKAAANIKAAASTNLEMKASTQVKIKGNAGAEVSSSGTTIIKGAMVQIN